VYVFDETIRNQCGAVTRGQALAAGMSAGSIRSREELLAALTDVASGAQSSLELRYLRNVERAHRLPRGSRQHAVRRPGGRWYDDVRHPGQPCVVAAQVATVLRASGWSGTARRCGPHCTVITESSCSQGYQNFP
jgi:hypothetical protein